MINVFTPGAPYTTWVDDLAIYDQLCSNPYNSKSIYLIPFNRQTTQYYYRCITEASNRLLWPLAVVYRYILNGIEHTQYTTCTNSFRSFVHLQEAYWLNVRFCNNCINWGKSSCPLHYEVHCVYSGFRKKRGWKTWITFIFFYAKSYMSILYTWYKLCSVYYKRPNHYNGTRSNDLMLVMVMWYRQQLVKQLLYRYETHGYLHGRIRSLMEWRIINCMWEGCV